MGSHSVTCHPTEIRFPPLPPAKAGTRFSHPWGMQGWVDLCYVKVDRLGFEPNLSVGSPTPYRWATTQWCYWRLQLVLHFLAPNFVIAAILAYTLSRNLVNLYTMVNFRRVSARFTDARINLWFRQNEKLSYRREKAWHPVTVENSSKEILDVWRLMLTVCKALALMHKIP